jgi:phage terminase large subunit GpA-like protein
MKMTNKEYTKIDKLLKKTLRNFLPPEKLTVTEWADKYRYLSPEASAIAGKYKSSHTPYMREVMDAFSDPNIEKIFVVSSSQIGKTETELNILGYIVDNDPCGVIFAVPTINDAKEFSKERVMPLIRDNPRVRAKFGRMRTKNSSNTIREKTFTGGVLNIVGVNVASQLASKPRRVVLADEIDRWTTNTEKEGDPFGLLEARTLTFYNRKIVAVSTPTIKGHSRIESHFYTGTQEYWSYECPKCKKYSHIQFANIKFKYDLEVERNKKTYQVKSVHWECPHCKGLFTENVMKNQPAKWIAHNPEAIKNRIRSFWLNGFCSPFPTASWNYIVWKFLDAGKDPEKLQTVFNTLLGEMWEDRQDLATEDEMLKRRELYDAELPEGVLFLTCGVDTQDNRLEYEVVGHGFHNEKWGIKKGVIMGRPSRTDTWDRLDDILKHSYTFKNGKALKIGITLVDSGGHYAPEVKRACRNRQHLNVFAIKGTATSDLNSTAPYVSLPKLINVEKNNPNEKCWLYTINVNHGKHFIYDCLKVKEQGEMYYHFPSNTDAGYDERYFNGLLSEVEVIRGNKVQWVVLAGHERNEPLDCRNYANAGFVLYDPDLEAQYNRLHEITENKEVEETEVEEDYESNYTSGETFDWE